MEANQSKIINIPRGYSSTTRQRIANDIVSRIKERTSLGLDVNNRPFSGYSPTYEKQGRVNLSLTGSMMDGLVVLSHGPGFVRLGFSTVDSNDKAAYIQTPRGQKAGKQPRRQFVGISQPDLNRILQRYSLDA